MKKLDKILKVIDELEKTYEARVGCGWDETFLWNDPKWDEAREKITKIMEDKK